MNTTLHVTGVWIAAFIVLYIILTLRVVRMRWKTGVGLGSGEDRPLLKSIRVHGNFAEYIPLLILSVSLLEVRGLSNNWLHGLFAAAFIGRLLLLKGITRSIGFSKERFTGNCLTFLVLLVSAGLHLSLNLR